MGDNSLPADSAKRGSVFAIGGREVRSSNFDVLAGFVSCCGGGNARLVVLTAASRDPAARVPEYDAAFRALGVHQVAHFHQEQRDEASDPALLAAVETADGVFFTGGSQLKLVSTIGGTPLAARLRARHLAGMHVGGTSAGASAMSAVMIARGTGGLGARLASVRMSPGLGFLPDVIVDQHFRERDRIGRLIAAVLCNPAMLGFGLDENTAFVLDASGIVSVCGSGTLTIVDGTGLEVTNVDEVPDDTAMAYAGIRLHALSAGWTYDLATRRVDPRAAAIGRTETPVTASAAATAGEVAHQKAS
jgi:cyanophycinase